MSLVYKISYQSSNRYDQGANGAIWRLLILPCTDRTQRLNSMSFQCSLLNKETELMENPFGFSYYLISLQKSFESVDFSLEAVVEKTFINPYEFQMEWPGSEEWRYLDSLESQIENHLFLGNSPLTQIVLDTPIFVFDRKRRVMENLITLNQLLFDQIQYVSGSTNVNTTANEAWQQRQGVCQDFSHIFLNIARQNKVPARYVSGYLSQGQQYRGAMQMHAWVEAFVPGLGWKGFDPSNGLLVDHQYIKIAHGADFSDCSPLKGIVQTVGQQHTTYHVSVANQYQNLKNQ